MEQGWSLLCSHYWKRGRAAKWISMEGKEGGSQIVQYRELDCKYSRDSVAGKIC